MFIQALDSWKALAVQSAVYISSIGFFALLGIAIYRLNFHPLAKYPGPLIGRLTDFYSVYQAYAGERHLNFYKLHQKYGKVVRYGPNKISFNSDVALKDIYKHGANVQKAHFYSAFPAQKGAWSTHSAIDKSIHGRKRRVLSQGFSENALNGLQPHILSVIRTFTDVMGDLPSRLGLSGEKKAAEEWSEPKDMAKYANYMSYDVLGDICYGESFNTLESPDNRFAVRLVALSSKYHFLTAQMPGLKKLGLHRVLFPDLLAQRTRFMGYSRARLQKRMQLGIDTDRRDFFYFLLNAKDPETGLGFSTQELWGESNVLLIAGSDTTSTAFSATFFYLLHYPEYLKELTKLVRQTFGSVEEIVSGPALNSLELLRACIDEAMRLSPPVPGLLPREVLKGGIDVDGMHFPTGTVVGVPTYALHHNAAYYPQPFAYNPSRFLASDEKTGSDRVQQAKNAFCPFSIGPRGCIGKGVALMELKIALARTIWLYDMKLADSTTGVGPDGNYALKDIFVAEKNGPMVQFRKRAV